MGETLPRSFDTPLPIDAVLDELARTLAANNAAVLVAPPGAGKTTRVPLALLDEPWAAGQKDHRAGAAADRGPRQRRADGEDAGRARRRNRRLPRPLRLEDVARDADRGRHRGHFLAPDPRRSRTDRRRRGAVRRIPRALARCRSGAGAGARRADRAARGSAHSRDVGDARRRAGRQNCSAMRRSSPAKAAPFRSRRAISAARPTRRWSGRWRTPSRARCAPIPARCWRFCRAPRKSAAPQNFLARARAGCVDRDRAAVRRARCRRAGPRDCAGAEGPAQGGAGDLDRRDLADHRGRPHRRRFRRGAGAALRAGHRADAAGDRARLARRGRSAPRPRRPHRARRLLPAVGRAADRVACGLHPAGNSLRRSVVAGARSRAMGCQRSRYAGVSRSAAGAGAEGGQQPAAANSARSMPTAGSPPRARACARWRCRRGWRG